MLTDYGMLLMFVTPGNWLYTSAMYRWCRVGLQTHARACVLLPSTGTHTEY